MVFDFPLLHRGFLDLNALLPSGGKGIQHLQEAAFCLQPASLHHPFSETAWVPHLMVVIIILLLSQTHASQK